MKKLWSGRFSAEPAGEAIGFNSSENISLDAELVPYDILGNLAHARMLYEKEILSTVEYEAIKSALKNIGEQWRASAFVLKKEFEDVHMNIEAAVSSATPAGKKLHTARSRNDQVMLDMRLYMRERVLGMHASLQALREAFAKKAGKDGPMAAYTHTRVAQPITVSFWCQGWADSFSRDQQRLREAYRRINQNPLGACAIAGTPWAIDRSLTARLLGFDGVQENEMDTITSRGECEAELLSALSFIMVKLSRLSEELIWLSQKGLITLAEEHTTGSSIMPNKKNPDVLEIIRGRAGRVFGSQAAVLTTLKGLMSGYHSDMQETKAPLMDGLRTTAGCIEAMAMVLGGMRFERGEIEKELDRGYAQATEIADHLAMKGTPFREAHAKAGALVKHCEKEGKLISGLDHTTAGKILGTGMGADEWKALRSLERPRLKRKVAVERSGFVGKEKKRIDDAYSAL
jgi:argininosuccinate lyase